MSWRPSTEKRRRTKKGKTLSDDGASSSEGLSSEEEEGDSNGGQLLGLPNEECKLVCFPICNGWREVDLVGACCENRSRNDERKSCNQHSQCSKVILRQHNVDTLL